LTVAQKSLELCIFTRAFLEERCAGCHYSGVGVWCLVVVVVVVAVAVVVVSCVKVFQFFWDCCVLDGSE